MTKKDFKSSITSQWETKNDSVLETKLDQAEDENLKLKDKIKELEKLKSGDLSLINITAIKLLSNIRGELDYEEIDELAKNIEKRGQLQPVLLSQDNYLLAGYRRFHAIKLLSEKEPDSGKIICYKIKRNRDEISAEELQEIQLAENDQRRPIDYFQLSKLYQSYKANSNSQKELTSIFKKSKGTISAILKIGNIDPLLVNYLKQFQIYAWSKNKYEEFAIANLDNLNEKDAKFFQDNKGIIASRLLYEIAKFDDLTEQKKAFLKLYKNRLTEEELNSDFSEIPEKHKETDISVLEKTAKQINSVMKTWGEVSVNDFKSRDTFDKINSKLQEIKELLEKEV